MVHNKHGIKMLLETTLGTDVRTCVEYKWHGLL